METRKRCYGWLWKAGVPIAAFLFIAFYWLLFHRTWNAGVEFSNSLLIPSEIRGRLVDGRKYFQLEVAPGSREFFTGRSTQTAGVNGAYLGPTIRVRRGDAVALEVVNHLNEVTTMHWHGLHVPARMDGTPHQEILPGNTWVARFEIGQEAGPMWYHPHPHGTTGAQVYRGIAGMFWIDDENSLSFDLPDDYGVDDIPLIVQDRQFDREGQFQYRRGQAPAYGDEILMNGTIGAYVDVESRLIRFRILNASNARTYHIGFEDNRSFHQIATDGGFLERPWETRRIILGSGERAEIVVDFSDGHEAKLMSFAEAGWLETMESFFEGEGNGRFDLLKVRPVRATRASHVLPDHLNQIERLDPVSANVTRTMRLGVPVRRDLQNQDIANDEREGRRGQRGGGGRGRGIPINRRLMDMHRIDERVRLGDTEIWEISNGGGQMHPFHVHLVQFQILDRNGQTPTGPDLGWKDTVRVPANESVRIIAQFSKYADPEIPYMYHCHIMEHEDGGMMGQFLVVEEPEELASLRGRPSVVLFIVGLYCSHCYEQIEAFDQAFAQYPVNLVVVSPIDEDGSRLELQGSLISDVEKKWAGWFGVGHEGHSHGTFLLDRDTNSVWSETGQEPFMDVEILVNRLKLFGLE